MASQGSNDPLANYRVVSSSGAQRQTSNNSQNTQPHPGLQQYQQYRPQHQQQQQQQLPYSIYTGSSQQQQEQEPTSLVGARRRQQPQQQRSFKNAVQQASFQVGGGDQPNGQQQPEQQPFTRVHSALSSRAGVETLARIRASANEKGLESMVNQVMREARLVAGDTGPKDMKEV